MANVTIVLKNNIVQSVYSNDPDTRVIVLNEYEEGSTRVFNASNYKIAPEETLKVLALSSKIEQIAPSFTAYTRSSAWCIDDVKEMRADLTEVQCRIVLDTAIDGDWDAEIGFGLMNIQIAADELFPEDNEDV